MSILAILEQRAGAWHRMSWETLAAAQQLGAELQQPVSAAVVGDDVSAPAGELAVAIDLRRRFPGITDNAQAQGCVRKNRELEAAVTALDQATSRQEVPASASHALTRASAT